MEQDPEKKKKGCIWANTQYTTYAAFKNIENNVSSVVKLEWETPAGYDVKYTNVILETDATKKTLIPKGEIITDTVKAFSKATGFPIEQIRSGDNWVANDAGKINLRWDVIIMLLPDNSGRN